MGDVHEVRKIVVAILNLHLGGISAHKLDDEYKKDVNERIPFGRYGYQSLDAFIACEVGDAIERRPLGFETIYFPRGTERTKHIVELKRAETKPRNELNYRTLTARCASERNVRGDTDGSKQQATPVTAPMNIKNAKLRLLSIYMQRKAGQALGMGEANAKSSDAVPQNAFRVPFASTNAMRSELCRLPKCFSEMNVQPKVRPLERSLDCVDGQFDGQFDGSIDDLAKLRGISNHGSNDSCHTTRDNTRLEFDHYVSDLDSADSGSEASRDRLWREMKMFEEELAFPQSVAEKLAPNTVVAVRVSDVNAPSKFWVQMQKYDEDLSKLHDDLDKFYRRNQTNSEYAVKVHEIKVADYYATTVDANWYRAMVEAISGDTLKLRLVDRGALLPAVDASNIRALDEQFYKVPILSVCCELSDIKPVYHAFTKASAEDFLDLVRDRIFFARIKSIVNTKQKIKAAVELIDKSTKDSINLKMVSAGHAKEFIYD